MRRINHFILTFALFWLPCLCSAPLKILVGSPIRQKPAILREFLDSLDRLDQSNCTLYFLFVDDNISQESQNLLYEFSGKKANRCLISSPEKLEANEPYVCTEFSHFWTDSLIWKVARFKDRIIEFAASEDFDYLFLLDSDLVLHPQTLNQLLHADKEVISNVFWTEWSPGTTPLPQVWHRDEYTLFQAKPGEVLTLEEQNLRTDQFLQQVSLPGVYEVGGLGACTLISRSALLKGVRFEKIPNLSFWGEDRHFCIRASALGIGLHVDTHYPALHLFRESELLKVSAFIQNCYRN